MKKQRFKKYLALVIVGCTLSNILFAGCSKKDGSAADTITAENAQEAAAKLGEKAEEFGYENALSELTEKSTTVVDGDSYYRLQQNYQGIPVYGRTVVCVTDENGNVTSTTGNILDVDDGINPTPTVTAEEISVGIVEYAENTLGLSSDECTANVLSQELVWCVDSSDNTFLAYSVWAYVDEKPYEIVVDAHTGKVHTASCQIMTESVAVNMSVEGNEHKVNLWQEADGSYITYDAENDIQVLSANGETLVKYLIFGVEGTTFFYVPSTRQWYNAQWKVCSQPPIRYDSVAFGFSTEENLAGVTQPTFTSLADLDEDACRILFFVTVANDYFSESLFRDGWGNGNTETLQVVYDCANGSYHYSPCISLSMLSIESGSGLNTVTHELTHALERSESRMIYSGESGAIMEALSDIFAEIVEYNFLGQCDWLYDGGVRNLVKPWLSTEDNTPHPSTYKGENWYSGSGDNGGVHYNSTVISHAAYLMSESGGGLLDTDDLAKLWYRAMLMMPSDCDFNDCRQLVELAATSMELTTAQIECVSEAFDEVGIAGISKESVEAKYNVKPGCTLSVYGGNGEKYDNYSLAIVTLNGPVIGPAENDYVFEETITSAEPYILNVPEGIYYCTVTDNANPKAKMTFDISVFSKNEDSKVDIYTNFGSTPVRGTVSTIKEENGAETNVPVREAVISVCYEDQTNPVETIRMEDKKDNIFELYDLPAGVYSFVTEAEGYITSTTVVELTAEKDVYLDIVLKPNEIAEVVTDAYSDTLMDDQYDMLRCYHIPQFNLPGYIAAAFNAEKYD